MPPRVFQMMLADVEAQNTAGPRCNPFRDEADPGTEIDDDIFGSHIEETHDPVGMGPAIPADIVDAALGFGSVGVANHGSQQLPVRLELGPG